MKNIFNRVLPGGTIRRKLVKKLLVSAGFLVDRFQKDFCHYVKYHERYIFLPKQAYKYKPLISIVIPVFNTPRKYLEQLVHSVINQTYEHWELVLADGSTQWKASETAKELSQWDDRIKYHNLNGNKGIAGNTNIGIKKARGEFVAFADHDDMLSVHALNEVVAKINENQQLDIVYSDEDKLSESGLKRLNPHFKPDWSPDLLRNVNYITHLLVVRKKLVDKIGGIRPNFEGAQDYDLILRLVDESQNIAHIPKILYHWRETESSTATNFAVKKDILKAGERALNDHLKRNRSGARASAIPGSPGFYRLTYSHVKPKPWTVVFLFPAEDLLTTTHLDSFLSSSKLHPDSLVVTPENIQIKAGYEQLKIDTSYIRSPNGFLNELASKVTTEQVIFIGNYLLFPLDSRWPDTFQEVLSESNTATVAPRFIDEGGVIKYLGYGNGDQRFTMFLNASSAESTYFGSTDWVRNTARQNNTFAIKTERLRQLIDPTGFNINKQGFHKDFFKRAATKNLFHVVWSHIDFRLISGLSEVAIGRWDFFNPNLDTLIGEVVMKSYFNNEDRD